MHLEVTFDFFGQSDLVYKWIHVDQWKDSLQNQIIWVITYSKLMLVCVCVVSYKCCMAGMRMTKGRVPKKKYVFLMVFLRIKKFTPIFFWKLNLWLPKRILHLVPLKNLSFLSSYNGLLFPLIDYSKGRGDHQGSHKVPLSKLSY